MEPKNEPNLTDVMDLKKNATFSLPVGVWAWLKDEALRRNTSASGVIVELVSQEKKAIAA
jgi:hypothetical protein